MPRPKDTFLLLPMLLLPLFLAIGCSEDDSDDDIAPAQDDDDDNDDSETTCDDWYCRVVFMEIFVRSYQDSDGDGIGDLPGLTARLPYLSDLGIGGLWLMPIYPTPFEDSGYDVADYTAINQDYGTMEDFRDFLDAAHALGLRVFLDGVFNHSSIENPWFRESRSSRDNPMRDWYVWADEPLFDCSAQAGAEMGDERWTWDAATGQYYFHHFRVGMPDLNHDNPALTAALHDVLRFWLDLGVDGFRLDVAHLYHEGDGLCEHHPDTHEVHRGFRTVLDEYLGRAMVGELIGLPEEALRYFGSGRDELHLVFHFNLTYAMYAALYLHLALPLDLMIDASYPHLPPGGQWALFSSNHDFFRIYDLLFRNPRRNRLTAALVLTLPGTPFLYYGEEIGMAGGAAMPIDYRDAARTPMHWTGETGAGFTTGEPWLPLAPNYATHNVALERDDPYSLYTFYRTLIHLRNESAALSHGDYQRIKADTPTAFAFFRLTDTEQILAVFNLASAPNAFQLDLSKSPWATRSGPVADLLTGRPFGVLHRTNLSAYSVSLPAYGLALLTVESE